MNQRRSSPKSRSSAVFRKRGNDFFQGCCIICNRTAFPIGSHLAENLVERIPGGDAETDGSDLDIFVAAAGIKNVGQFDLGKSVILAVRQHHNDFPADGVGRNFV